VIKFIFDRVAKLMSYRHGQRRSSIEAGRLVSPEAIVQQPMASASGAPRFIGTPASRSVDPQSSVFKNAELGDRLPWPARDASKTRKMSDAADPAPGMLALGSPDVTRQLVPAVKPCEPAAERTVLLKSSTFSSRPVDDATRIVTPRKRL
jgi:hypothetical protein